MYLFPETTLTSAHFPASPLGSGGGGGHLRLRLRRDAALRDSTSFSLSLRTFSADGLVLWVGGGHAPASPLTTDDYLGVGIRGGMLHLVWNLGWFSRTELTIPR